MEEIKPTSRSRSFERRLDSDYYEKDLAANRRRKWLKRAAKIKTSSRFFQSPMSSAKRKEQSEAISSGLKEGKPYEEIAKAAGVHVSRVAATAEALKRSTA